jgi:hypothetical protein
MTCANLFFNHSGDFSSDISISSSGFRVGTLTTIYVRLHNASTWDGFGTVELYWAAIKSNNNLDLPATKLVVGGELNPLSPQTIPAQNSYLFSYTWAPDTTVIADTTDPIHIAIFAQAIGSAVTGSGAGACAGWSHPTNFDPTQTYNAMQKFKFASAPMSLALSDPATMLLASSAEKAAGKSRIRRPSRPPVRP